MTLEERQDLIEHLRDTWRRWRRLSPARPLAVVRAWPRRAVTGAWQAVVGLPAGDACLERRTG